jgi:hypothetical protein
VYRRIIIIIIIISSSSSSSSSSSYSRVRLSPFGTAATTGLLYKPQIIDVGDCGEIGKCKLQGETEVFGENLPQRHSVHHKSHTTWHWLEPGPPRWKASGLVQVYACRETYPAEGSLSFRKPKYSWFLSPLQPTGMLTAIGGTAK